MDGSRTDMPAGLMRRPHARRTVPVLTLVALAGLPGYATAASYSLAHSRSESVEVFVDHAAGQPWCGPALSLRFAFTGPPSAGVVERLLPKLGSLLNQQCPQSVSASWQSIDANGLRVAQGTASKAGAWVPQFAAVDLSDPVPAAAPPRAAMASPSAAGFPDVVGIKPGMSEAEVRRLLEASETRYKIGTHTVSYPQISEEKMAVELFAEVPGERISVNLSPLPRAMVIRVQRSVDYPASERPLASSIVQALEQKYGKPTQASVSGHEYRWFFDGSGRLRASAASSSSCPGGRSGQVTAGNALQQGKRGAQVAALLGGGVVDCGLFVFARVETDYDRKEIATGFTVSVNNPPSAVDAYAESREILVRAAEEQRQKELREAQAREAPRL